MKTLGYIQLFKELWQFLQAYGRPGDTEGYWDSCFGAVDELRAKYKGGPLEYLSDKFTSALLKHLHMQWKCERRRKGC